MPDGVRVAAAVYDVMAGTLLAQPVTPAVRRRAFAASLRLWGRAVALEGCAVPLGRALRASSYAGEVPDALHATLREAGAVALRDAIRLHRQLPALAKLAAAHGIRLALLKGAARLLAGEAAGMRSMADVDVLVPAADAARLHALMQSQLGFEVSGRAAPHHLPGLSRTGDLGVELHHRLSERPLPLDAAIWHDARWVDVGGHPVAIPSPTMLVLHTLEHAAALEWARRYRLRDVLDVAALWTVQVDEDRVLEWVHANEHRRAHATLLAAAHAVNSCVPAPRAHAWSTVRRVARLRLAAAAVPRTPLLADRAFRYASVLAEGSPRSLLRLVGVGRPSAARASAAATPVAGVLASGVLASGMLALASCRDATPPTPLAIPAFVFVSDAEGAPAIYRFRGDTVTRLSASGVVDLAPHSAAGRIVFASQRDNDTELYLANLELGDQRRLTVSAGFDGEPALDAAGTRIAFVSVRSGTPRIWLTDTLGTAPTALATGSPTLVPERAPAWSPAGDRLAFTSTRTGTSQVWVVAAAGGAPVQVTHETGGAFEPVWTPDGRSIRYVGVAGTPQLKSVPAGGGPAVEYAADSLGLGEPACVATLCLATTDPYGTAGDIVAVAARGGVVWPVLRRAADDRHPALLVP